MPLIIARRNIKNYQTMDGWNYDVEASDGETFKRVSVNTISAAELRARQDKKEADARNCTKKQQKYIFERQQSKKKTGKKKKKKSREGCCGGCEINPGPRWKRFVQTTTLHGMRHAANPSANIWRRYMQFCHREGKKQGKKREKITKCKMCA